MNPAEIQKRAARATERLKAQMAVCHKLKLAGANEVQLAKAREYRKNAFEALAKLIGRNFAYDIWDRIFDEIHNPELITS